MKIVLLSGGSGKRLWPLSNGIRSKQFLKVVQGGDGRVESMLQRVYRQMQAAGVGDGITVATGAAQVESIRGQLGERVSVVVEPERRNTFPAIALSAAYLYFEKGCPPGETVVVLPVDPYVGEEYFKMLHKLDSAVQADVADIVLMGVAPTYPSEKYGYIIPDLSGKMGKFANPVDAMNADARDVDSSLPVSSLAGIRKEGGQDLVGSGILPVLKFREKPDVCAAQELIAQGGLWNCGVFAFKLSYLMGIVQKTVPCACYADVQRQYTGFEGTSFDYAVVEKADGVAVLPYHGEWKDLGTWNTLTEVMEEKPIGDVMVSDQCRNTHVINELGIPIVVMGANDMIVVASPDGILVSDKEQSSYIKRYVEDRDMRPMFEERSWGEYRVLDMAGGEDGMKSLTKRKKIREGERIAYQVHQNRSEVWTVLSGKCIITINDRAHEAFAGDTYSVPAGVKHGLFAVTDTEVLEVQVGKELIKDGTELIPGGE